jgi:hypothetical protein
MFLLRNISKRLEPGLILWHGLSNGKKDTKFGTWIVRSLYRVGAMTLGRQGSMGRSVFGWLKIGSSGGLL